MITITSLFQQAQLAEAAYANFFDISGNLITTNAGLVTALTDNKFSQAQATAFLTQWEVVDQYTASGALGSTDTSGFSATLFRNKTNGQYSFAMRGSQTPVDFLYADFSLATGGVALDQLISMVNYVLRLDVGATGQTAQFEVATSLIDGSRSLDWSGAMVQGAGPNIPLIALSNLTVTGHSLGGALAQMYQRIFDSLGVNTFNSMGIGNANSPFFDQLTTMLGLPIGSFSSGAGSNLVVSGEPANHLGTVLGDAQIQIFTETENTLSAHMMGYVTDSLAVYNLLSSIDPGLSIASITNILKSSSNVAANSLESAVSALGKLFGVSGASNVGSARNDLYLALDALRQNIYFNYTIRDLSAFDAAQIASVAGSNIAYRYALKELNAFAVLDAYYPTDGSLDVYNPATGQGALTTEWLQDRAAMLALVIQGNIQDSTVAEFNLLGSNYYEDVTTGIKIDPYIASQRIIFGGEGADTLEGNALKDKLYGGAGGDTRLKGSASQYFLSRHATSPTH